MTLNSPFRLPVLRPTGWHCLLLLLLLPLKPAFAQQVYEAENAVLSNGARTADCQRCPSGAYVQYVGGDQDGTVNFDHVVVPQDGLYPVTVDFVISDDRPLVVTVNQTTRREVIFYKTAKPPAISSQTILVPLRAGTNMIAFDNPHEYGPDLDRITVAADPVPSCTISGTVKDLARHSMPDIEVALAGPYGARATTDATGRYEFRDLPAGDYYARPAANLQLFAPVEQFCPATVANAVVRNFIARPLQGQTNDLEVMESGKWRIEYDLSNGLADFYFEGKPVIARTFAMGRMPETVSSADYRTHRVSRQPVQDDFGSGTKLMVESVNARNDRMTQTFWLYTNADFMLMQMSITRPGRGGANYMAPLVSSSSVDFAPGGDDRALFVPYDNDKWIRYAGLPFGGTVTSHEVSALYDNQTRRGMVIGSIEHDVWKTGVKSVTDSNRLAGLEVFGGLASARTRDVLPHGKVVGRTIQSPKIFVGVFSDWRQGLDAFARANTVAAPRRVWTNGVPFGWNSWGKLQFRLSFEKAVQVSDYIATELQTNHFENHGVVYVGLDSGWDHFTDAQLKAFVDRCHTNGQEAGIYFAPFAAWGKADDAKMDDSGYRYRDIYLYANGKKQLIDGGAALDPTHPGTQRHIQATVRRIKKAGFKYLKVDFLTQAALEADRYFDPHVTTGMQAYNEGMAFLVRTLGRDIYLNQAISPVFPARYAESRRIACDTFGDIGKTEYTLNALTYGWWLDAVYDFNDPDHVVLGGYSEGENRARVTSAVITGLFLSGDDLSDEGDAAAKKQVMKYLTNDGIDFLARQGKSFHPLEGNTANVAANVFVRKSGDGFYLAAFNYSQIPTNIFVDLERAGLSAGHHFQAKELWSGDQTNISTGWSISVPPQDAVLYQISDLDSGKE